MTARGAARSDRYFYFFMSLLMAVVIGYGFSHTVNKNLIHADVPHPLIILSHAAIFSGGVLFFIFRSALVQMHNVRLHRLTCWFEVALGVVVPVLGVSTAITRLILGRSVVMYTFTHSLA